MSSLLWYPINKSTTVAIESTQSQNSVRHMPKAESPKSQRKMLPVDNTSRKWSKSIIKDFGLIKPNIIKGIDLLMSEFKKYNH